MLYFLLSVKNQNDFPPTQPPLFFFLWSPSYPPSQLPPPLRPIKMIPSPSYQTPSLASVLATLAAYAPPPLPPPPLLPPSAPSDLEEGEYDPSEPPTTTTNLDPRLQPPQPRPAVPPFQPPALTHPPSPAPTPSPSKITTWPPALRHVTRYLVPNPDTVRRIGHLIRSQHQHERQWWAGREALVQKLEGREEGRRKLNSVLLVFSFFTLYALTLS